MEYVIFRNIPKMYNQGKIYFSLKYLKWNAPKNCKTRKILKFLEYGIFQKLCKTTKIWKIWNMEYSGLFLKNEKQAAGA